MDFPSRACVYEKIENYRKRPLIAYATSTRQGAAFVIAGDAVRVLIDAVDSIPSEAKEIDILLHSAGGDALTAWKMMSVLRERFQKISVLIPSMAFSAATVFALGADEIVMHPHASLGPIDPQITVFGERPKRFSYEDLAALLRFLKEDVGIQGEEAKSSLVEKLFSTLDPLVVGGAKRASDLMSSVGERLLKTHMGSEEEAKQIAETLNKSFFAHGDAVSRTRAKTLRLKIADTDPELEKHMWDAFLGLEAYMKLREPFEPLSLLLQDPKTSSAMKPLGPLVFPPNLSPQVIDNWLQEIVPQIVYQQVQKALHPPEIEVEIIHAVVESAKTSAEHLSTLLVSGVASQAGEFKIATLTKARLWRTHPVIPTEASPSLERKRSSL